MQEGLQCVYSPAKPRQSKASPAEQEVPAQPAAPAAVPDEEPEDLGSPGFHSVPANEPVPEPVHEPVREPVSDHFHQQVNETANEPIPEPVHPEIESPSRTFTQSHGIYQQHSSGLTFPQAGTTSSSELAQSSIPSAPVEYAAPSASEISENSLSNYTYPAPAGRAGPEYLEQTTSSVEQVQQVQRGTSVSQPTSRRSLPTSQPSHQSPVAGATMNPQSSWQSMPGSSAAAVSATRTSPGVFRTKKPAPVTQAYDDFRQHTSSWANTNQSASQGMQTTRASLSQIAAQPARAKSRQSNWAQSHTPVNSMSAVRPGQSQGTGLSDDSGYGSAAATQQSASVDSYNNYNQYQSAASAQQDSSSDRIAYQPYTNNQTSASSNSYSSFDNHDTRLSTTASSALSTPTSQNVASSYQSNSVTAPSTTQWGSATSASQARNSRAYNATQAASTTSSYNMSSNSQQSQLIQGFNVRPPPSNQARS